MRGSFFPWSKCRAERPSVTKSQKDSSDIPLEKAKSLNHRKSFLESQLYVLAVSSLGSPSVPTCLQSAYYSKQTSIYLCVGCFEGH